MNRLTNILCLCVAMSVFTTLSAQNNAQLANHYFGNQEFDKAAEIYAKLYSSEPNDFHYRRLLQCYTNQKLYSDAEKTIKKRMRQQPDDLSLFVDWGQLDEQRGKKKKADKHYRSALEKIGYNKSSAIRLAEAFDNIGQCSLAVETYRLAGQKVGNPNIYTIEMAQLYEKYSEYEKMTTLLFDFLDQYPYALSQVQLLLQPLITQNSNTEFERGLKNTLARHIANAPQNQTYQDLMIWFSLQKKDFVFALQQAKAIDQRFAQDQGEQVYRVAQIASANNDYVTAIEGYSYLMKKGDKSDYYFDSYTGLLGAKYLQATTATIPDPRAINALVADYEKALGTLGTNPETVPLQRNYAQLLAMHKNNTGKATDMLYHILDMPSVPAQQKAETKLQLGDLLLFSGQVWEASLLYMQVEKDFKNDIIGSQAKFKNAQLSYYNADFQWAKSQLDVLRASTSKPIANDAMQLSLLISDNIDDDSTFAMLTYFAKGDMMMYQKKYAEACQYYDSVTVRNLQHPLLDEILMRKAQIALQQGQYTHAESLLTELVQKYPYDILADDAFFMLATLCEGSLANPAKALEYYQKIILDYPASLYVTESRKKYNTLKNKQITT